MLETLKQSLSRKGYRVFSRPHELNIVGIRAVSNIPDAFDDSLCVFYHDGTSWQFHSYPATTDPGMHYLRQPINGAGTAILKAGQYENCYGVGLHRGLYTALVQIRPVTVIRDFNKDGVLDFRSGHEQTGMFGINIHRAEQSGITKRVAGYSAGCQVFANASDFNAFMTLCQQHRAVYGNKFTYTLIEQADLPAAGAMAARAGGPAAALQHPLP
ncbi:hypothetical protein HGH93_12045 [Chitinophaga polysaccharea]|uniref:hypothetical protein n=1 Tax=Chitinophaga polysaccharea TaxID=1293035 RepID=UPI001455DA00|nr:hypothetical protein [Chitinophaga polysaccharea]NLR58838.1 hypothetical protein [Chitinophaga polysaccharea]